jgi:short-subunit dehydrogenase
MKRILIMGATSAIAEASARVFAQRGDSLMLAGRNAPRLAAIAEDLRVRGAPLVGTCVIDARELERAGSLIEQSAQRLGGLDVVMIAHGTLSDQAACERSFEVLRTEFQVNALSYMALGSVAANYFAGQGRGVIAFISSVAGDRGRQSNYAYGTAKAAVTAFASGLRQRLYPQGIGVVTIKPGFVDTPMTASFKKGLLWASPQKVAADIVRAIDRATPVIYTPWFWRPIMAVIQSVPETVFRRLRL